jgi:Tol biopolymer transport system component
MPFPTVYLLLLALLALVLMFIPFMVVHRRMTAAGRLPGLAGFVVASLVAFAIPQALGAVVPFRLPTPVPVPGLPTVYVSASPYGNTDLWAIHGGGDVRKGQITRLTETTAREEGPSVSPDGASLVYASNADGTFDLWILPLADARPSGPARHLTENGRGDEFLPRWSPDGRWIAYTQIYGDHTDIVLIHPNGTGRHALTHDGDSFAPSWSPDGSLIAFSRPTSDQPDDYAIWTMSSDGSHAAEVADTPSDDAGAVWFADGVRFAFTAGTSTHADIWLGGADGLTPLDLTPNTPRANDVTVGVGPEGQILFASNRAPTTGNFLYFMNPDGSDVTLAAIV